MSKPCEASGSQKGILVETWSGDIHGPLCTLSTGAQVFHMVRVHNLMLYPALILCKGSLGARPRRVDFNSTRPGDMADVWYGTFPNLGAGLDYVFSHCGLKALAPGLGDERVDTEVTILWRQRGVTKVVPLSFKVAT
jgi:hypothetical protein